MIFITAIALGVIACWFGFSSNEDPIFKFIGKTDEYLSNLIAEINSIPVCSERHLLALTVMTYIMDPLNSEYVIDTTMALPQVSEKFIPELLEQLSQSLRQEGLLSSKAQKSLDQIKIKLAYHKWKEAHREVKNLFKEIRPLDIPDMFRLIRKSDETANLIKDQDIVLLVGPTGVGKTTTIHSLAGSKMIETTENGMYHVAPTKISNPDLLNAATSASSVSQTRYISPARVNLRDIDRSYNGDLILWSILQMVSESSTQ
jgi:ABC-type multidrug transport system fused ATPase/permease subunit